MSDHEPGSYEDFIARFNALHEEAKGYGFALITVMMDNDILTETEGKWIGYTNGQMATLGLLEYAKHRMLAEINRDIWTSDE